MTRTALRVDNGCMEETKPHATARRLIDQRQTTHSPCDITLLNFAIWLLRAKAAGVATGLGRRERASSRSLGVELALYVITDIYFDP